MSTSMKQWYQAYKRKLQKSCSNNKIKKEHTVTETPEENGVAEQYKKV